MFLISAMWVEPSPFSKRSSKIFNLFGRLFYLNCLLMVCSSFVSLSELLPTCFRQRRTSGNPSCHVYVTVCLSIPVAVCLRVWLIQGSPILWVVLQNWIYAFCRSASEKTWQFARFATCRSVTHYVSSAQNHPKELHRCA